MLKINKIKNILIGKCKIVKKITMKKLTYTKEMKKQDKLWESENEDLYIMEKLMNEIIEEAKTKGFTGTTIIYDGKKEKITEVFENKEQLKSARLGKFESLGFGYCKPLINYLEEILNK